MLLLFFFFLGGYAAGWIARQIFSCMKPSIGNFNLKKGGISTRSWLAIVLVIFGFYFEFPLITFLAGFAWYEARSKWCVFQSVKMNQNNK